MPIITIDLNGDELFYDFDRRSKDEVDPVSVSITDEEFEQITKLRVEMDKLQKILHDKYKEAEALKKAFDELHKPAVVVEEDVNEKLLNDMYGELGKELEAMKKSYRIMTEGHTYDGKYDDYTYTSSEKVDKYWLPKTY